MDPHEGSGNRCPGTPCKMSRCLIGVFGVTPLVVCISVIATVGRYRPLRYLYDVEGQVFRHNTKK